jgi:uncharacterized pyridoxamine 5'-phosphate oxidase family protein
MEKTFETEVLTRLTAIETKLDDYKGTKEKVEDIEKKAEKAYTLSADNKEEIKQIKDNNKWLFRTTVGAIIVGLIGIGISIFNK